MKSLIIAEKPSLGRTVASAIPESFERKDGYMESDNYIVSWGAGHLYELKELDSYFPDYDPKKKGTWRLDRLPFYPDDWAFEYEVKRDGKTRKVEEFVAKTVKTLQALMNRKDVDVIYNCGDPDREGQRLCDEIIQYGLKSDKTIMRLWLPALDKGTIQNALRTARANEEYGDFSESAKTRAEMDWLYGIELTRYASIKRGSFVRIGRCVCPIAAQVVHREQEIKNFIPKPYSAVISEEKTNGEVIKLASKRTFDEGHEAEAQQLADAFNKAGAMVTDIKTEKKVIHAPKLFSLSDLQSFVCKQDKTMTPADVLANLQKLYEAGYTTYPRTNSSYLPKSEAGNMDAAIQKLAAAGITGLVNKPKSKAIYDDSKVEAHSAITPTGKMPGALSSGEQTVYDAILNRFCAVFCAEECTVDRTTMTIHCHDEDFVMKGDVQLTPGWRKYEPAGAGDKILPKLAKGDKVNIDFKPVGKMTTPPKRYTVESLNNWMLTPLRNQEETEDELRSTEYSDEEWKEILSDATICTEATRADTIARCIASGYISLKKGTYYGEDAGFELVDIMKKLGIDLSVETTVRLSKQLHAVAKAQLTRQDVLEYTKGNIDKVFDKNAAIERKPSAGGSAGGDFPVIGTCPVCGNKVVETKNAFRCCGKGEDGKYCMTYIPKDKGFFAAIHKKPTKTIVAQLLKDGKAPLKGCTGKSGKKFDCTLLCTFKKGEWPEYKMDFGQEGEPKPFCKCPVCGGQIVETGRNYHCTGELSDGQPCVVTLWKEDKFFASIHKKMTAAVAKQLLEVGKAHLTGCTGKSGKKFDCDVFCLFKAGEKYPKYEMEFPKK